MLRFLCLGLLVLSSTTPAQDVDVRRKIVYAERDGQKLMLDLFRPKNAGKVPFGLVVHGGAWRKGGRYYPDAMTFCKMLNAAGAAAASIDYRLVPRAVHPAQVNDCARALQFLRANADEFGLDPDHVVTIGASAGGHLAAMLGTMDDAAQPESDDPVARCSTKPQCVVAYFGPMIFGPTADAVPRAKRIVKDLIGGGSEDNPADVARAQLASPYFHVSADDPPMLLVHGTADWLVPLAQSTEMAAALAKVGVPHAVVQVEGGSHGDFVMQGMTAMYAGEPAPEFWSRTQTFLRAQLFGAQDRTAAAKSAGGRDGER